jgi:hypothetical protein
MLAETSVWVNEEPVSERQHRKNEATIDNRS